MQKSERSMGALKELRLRDAEAGDRTAIREVTLAAYQEYAAKMPAHWERYREGILSTLSAVAPAEQVVAEQDGRLVGTVLLYPPGTIFASASRPSVPLVWPEMRLLAVAPAARGGGVGTALVDECIRRARRNGSAVLTLHTSDAMQTAMKLYERIGFVRAPELDFHPAPDLTVKGYRFDLEAGRP
jgi:GNAT superfamily N-acetyltransferase